jgi:TrmH family RNA methyltransferase
LQELSKEKFKQIHKLKSEKGREKEGKFLIEGLRMCEEALLSFWEVEFLLFTPDFIRSERGKKLVEGFREMKIELLALKRKELEKLSEEKTPQGVMAVVKKRKFFLERTFLSKAFLLLGLDNIRDPGNLGTIIRTADSAGVDGVLLSRGCVELYNPKVVRSSMGSIFHLPVIERLNLKEIIPVLKSSGFKILASDVREGKDYSDVKYPDRICLLVGSEASGIDKGLLSLSDEKIRIPIYGKAESLNASVATGILLYEIAGKKRNFSKGQA